MHSYYLELCILTCVICSKLDHLAIKRVILLPSYTCPSHLGSTMMVPNRSSGSSSDVVACWPAAYDAPTLPTIKALASLSGAKGEPHGGLDKESGTVVGLAWPIENIQPVISHKIQPMHLAGIELGLHL